MIIGHLTYNAEQDTYLGDVLLLNTGILPIALQAAARRSDKEPDYRITSPTDLGHVDIGVAWKRTSERGKEYVSVLLDSPSLSEPINVALFFADDDNTAALHWNRQKAKPASEGASAHAGKAVTKVSKKAA